MMKFQKFSATECSTARSCPGHRSQLRGTFRTRCWYSFSCW